MVYLLKIYMGVLKQGPVQKHLNRSVLMVGSDRIETSEFCRLL